MLRCQYLTLLILSFISIELLSQQTADSPTPLNVYVDCSYCDMTLLRSKINYINYVRDRNDADIHLLINRISSGANGFKHTLQFIGRETFESKKYELKYDEQPNTTRRERHEKIGQAVETGLIPFWMETSLRDQINVQIDLQETDDATDTPFEDPWNHWVFSVEAGGSFEVESNTNEYVGWTRVRADRVSELWRVRNILYGRYDSRRFENDDNIITSTRERSYMSSSVVRSMSDHMSAGMFVSASRSTFSNLDLATRLAPAIEFSIFPYSEVHAREFTIAYRISHLYRDYTEQTIFLELAEHLFNESLVMAARFRQPWGSLYAQLEASHFFHDFSQNRIEFEGSLSLKVSRGLSLTLGNEVQIINDQRSLPARDISLEELLLAQRQSATNFRVNGRLGLRYTFGSLYNNIVNTRL